MKKAWIPNSITLVRIAGALALFWLEPLGVPFFAVYFLCGLSDLLDGTLARLLHAQSDLGSRLDSIADLLFYGAMFLRIIPILVKTLPGWIWIFVAAVVMLRLCAYLAAAVRYHRFASLHTYLNKFTGFCVFLIPCGLRSVGAVPYCIFATAVGMLSSLEELLIHLVSAAYDPSRKSLFFRRKR